MWLFKMTTDIHVLSSWTYASVPTVFISHVINYFINQFDIHSATSREVSGSIPDVIGYLNWPNPSSSTMAEVDSASNRNDYQEFSWRWRVASA
jgi:hypothetical protein